MAEDMKMYGADSAQPPAAGYNTDEGTSTIQKPSLIKDVVDRVRAHAGSRACMLLNGCRFRWFSSSCTGAHTPRT